jgi:hypothetical protein
MAKKKSKFIVLSTPLSPMALILMIFVVVMIIDLRVTDHKSSLSWVDHVAEPMQRLPPTPPMQHYHHPRGPTPPRHHHPHGSESFRKIGFLESRELADSIILPLFGDAAPFRRHRWNYYTVTDTRQSLSSVKLPVTYKDRSCVDEVACDELYSGDDVRVHGYDTPFSVHVY